MRHGNYVVYTILYTDQFKSDFISYYLTYFLCNNINQTQGLLYMTTATPGAHSIILQILLTGFIFYISLRCLQRFPEPFSGKFRNNCSVNRNFPELYSVTFRNSRTTSRKFPFTEKHRSGNRSGIPDFRNLFHYGNGKNFRIISVRNP